MQAPVIAVNLDLLHQGADGETKSWASGSALAFFVLIHVKNVARKTGLLHFPNLCILGSPGALLLARCLLRL